MILDEIRSQGLEHYLAGLKLYSVDGDVVYNIALIVMEDLLVLEQQFFIAFKYNDRTTFFSRAQYVLEKMKEHEKTYDRLKEIVFCIINSLHNFLTSAYHDRAVVTIQPLLFAWSLYLIDEDNNNRLT
jgi:hypothetical protein